MSDEVKLLPCEEGAELADILRERCNENFDGECHLTNAEADRIITFLTRAIEATRPTDEVVERVAPFPMLDGPAIPRWLAEIVYQAYGTSGQSLDRIAERGGFGWKEVAYLFSELKRRKPSRHAELLAEAIAAMKDAASD